MATPKQRFLLTPDAKTIAPILTSAVFDATSDAAMLQFMHELGTAQYTEDAAAREWKREGAMRMMEVLKGVATLPPNPPEPISSTLKE